eukprot:6400709-Pyramimonas_sp.AAC.1
MRIYPRLLRPIGPQVRLSEMELEKFAFVLLSQLETLTAQPGALDPSGWGWRYALLAAQLSVSPL